MSNGDTESLLDESGDSTAQRKAYTAVSGGGAVEAANDDVITECTCFGRRIDCSDHQVFLDFWFHITQPWQAAFASLLLCGGPIALVPLAFAFAYKLHMPVLGMYVMLCGGWYAIVLLTFVAWFARYIADTPKYARLASYKFFDYNNFD